MKQDRIRQGWRDWLVSNDRGWRIIVGFVCVVCLALFLHFREDRIEVLELNATAGRYVVAQVDFEFPDYETTVILKQQAMQDVGTIFQLSDRQIREARSEFEDLLIRTRSWREAAPSSSFEEIYKTADELETLLIEARFTDPRTMQKVKELNLPGASFYEFLPESPTDRLALPPDFWEALNGRIQQARVYPREAIAYVIRFFQGRKWDFSEDVTLEHALRYQLSQTIPEKFTRVSAGTRLIDQGEVITSRHLAMMQAMKQAISESRRLWDPLSLIASFLIALILVVISALYLRISQMNFIRSLQQVSLFVCIVILTLLFAKATEYVLLKSTSAVIEAIRYPIVAPFATLLICILLSPRTALFAATFLSIILSVSLAVDHSRFLVLNLVTSIVIIISSRSLKKRKEVFSVCLKSWLSSLPVLYAYTLSENHLWSSSLASDAMASLFFLLASAVLVVGLLPALETIFGVFTDMSLMEYMNPSSELLKNFAAAVPGTYQHSLVLGNLAETCAQSIGANGLFCRVATLYHDIGKMNNPQFYTENQQSAVNIHHLLTPQESAQVIISHVSDGVELGRKHHLPESFIDIIREHHGTTLVYYFYRKQLELQGGRMDEEEERRFRYPGPKPRSKESAIIMICDSVEAASRSIDEISESSLAEMVNRLVAEKAEDGQFDDSQLTFEELSRVKKTLVKTLLLTHHIRVKYPKKEKSH